jgi:hypothetical protein
MKCNDKNIKELLPAYLEQKLDQAEQKLVEKHLAFCDDCRIEYSLLQMMAEESVPDPGEALWAAMPGRIQREVLRKKERFSLSGLLNALLVPRGAWTAAALALLVIGLWFLLRPGPVEIADTNMREELTAFDMITEDPINVAEFSSSELDAASQWAQNEFEPIQESIGEDLENTQRDISDDLSNLSTRELDRLYEMLNKKERDMKNKLRKKSNDEKGLG